MADRSADEEFQVVAFEFGQYLSDQIPPLLAADCIESLMRCPPDAVAAGIRSWVGNQHRASSALTFSDYLFHAVKKIHMIGEYRLLPIEEVQEFIDHLKPHILSYCPPNEQAVLARSLNSMDSMTEAAPARLDVVYSTPKESTKAEAAPPAADLESELGRISIFLERLKKEVESRNLAGMTDRNQAHGELISDILVQTARAAQHSSDLDKAFEYIRGMGLQAGTADVIRALGRNLPEWSLTPKENFPLPEDKNLAALRRIVAEAPDPKEAGSRFHQLIQTVVERLNTGHLQQATNMVDLAEKMIAAKEVDQNLVDNLRNRGHEEIQLENLRKYTETPDLYPQLQKVLNFFHGLTPSGLLDMLRQEEKRERRRLLMALIEVHRENARFAVLARLRTPFSQNFSTEEGYFRRNLLYLLRRIPPSAPENEAEVIDIVARHTDLDFPVLVTKEAISYLGYFKHKDAEDVLKALLSETESLLTGGKGNFNRSELLAILDRLCSALARAGTPSARKILLDHSFSKNAKWGDTMARLADLATQDLTGDIGTMERLLSALHASLPRKLLGFTVRAKEEDLKSIVQALSGTSDPDVRETFEDLARKFPETAAAQLAAKATPVSLQAQEKKTEGASSLEGDLQLFGLPGLFQNLADHQLSGTLTLKRPDGQPFGTLELSDGMFLSCSVGSLKDEIAVYQLLERPQPGTFHFVRGTPSQSESKNVKALFPMVLEGVRRYDEFSEARAVLPDHVRIAGSGLQPAVFPDEKDGILFRDLWNVVRKGATPLECESHLQVDAYRIRRLLVHWYQSGSITIVY